LRDGSYELIQANINSSGADDLLTRGHGSLLLPPKFDSYADYERPRKGNWSYKAEAQLYGGGLEGNHKLGYRIEITPTYYVSDAFNLYVGAANITQPDYLVWQHDNLIGSFDTHEAHLNAGFNWTITERQELRVKLQTIGLDASIRQGYRVNENGTPVRTVDPIDSFSVRDLAFQIRYRYELAPLSYLYVVYGRGGYHQGVNTDDAANLLRDSFSLRDDDQLLVKLSYRFET
jgi:hypothetical protein